MVLFLTPHVGGGNHPPNNYSCNRDARIDVGSGVPKSFSDCIAWAKLMFNELFHDSIIQLLKRYPPDCKDEEGEPFWGGSSTRFLPTPIRLDSGSYFSFYCGFCCCMSEKRFVAISKLRTDCILSLL